MKRQNKQNLFPWREDGHYELLVNGKQFFPRMLDAIHHAREYILFENYLIESSHIACEFIQAFIAVRQRGVSVRLLFDDYGARDLNNNDRQQLLDAGIELVFYNPFNVKHLIKSLRRDHRKILIIDGSQAFVGGAGITDEFTHDQHHSGNWHDVMVQIQGPVLQDWVKVFLHTWEKCQAHSTQLPIVTEQHFANGLAGRVTIAKGPHLQEINRSLIKRFRSAERQIWLMTPYFVAAIKIRRELKKAARRGIDVRLILPAASISDHPWVTKAARGFYHRLLKNGIKIYEYRNRFPHAKIELCDNWVSLGSNNLDRWNQRWNMDANQEIDGSQFAEQVRSLFLNDFEQCEHITLEQWQQRPRLNRLHEWFWGRFVMLLERFSRTYQK